MNIYLYSPWNNRWRNSLQQAFEKKGHEVDWIDKGATAKASGEILTMWADDFTVYLSNEANMKFYTFVRSYEVYENFCRKINWKNVKGIFFCSRDVQYIFNEKNKDIVNGVPQYFVPNWIDLDEFPFIEHKPGKTIGMLCHVFWKKNIPLALYIIKQLEKGYTLHLAGEIQDQITWQYIYHAVENLKIEDRVFYDGSIPFENVKDFFSKIDFILSTSLKEGNPMNILEGMASGLKPVIHNWPGATEQFDKKWIFNWIDEVLPILEGEYNPREYRDFVESNYSLKNAEKLVEIVTQ